MLSRKKFNTDINQRIKMVRELKNLTQQEFAEQLGIAQGFLSEIERGRYQPRKPLLLAIAYLYQINYDWLLTGKAKREEGKGPLILYESGIPYTPSGSNLEEFIEVPQVKGCLSPSGNFIPETEGEMKISFRQDWMKRRGKPENLTLLKISGDSMEPTLKSGDMVLIDRNQNKIDPHGGIYALFMEGEIMIKRLQVLYPLKKIKIISDNSRYGSIEMDFESLPICGKVIWFGRELDR